MNKYKLAGIPVTFQKKLEWFGDDQHLKDAVDAYIGVEDDEDEDSFGENIRQGFALMFFGSNGQGKSALMAEIAKTGVDCDYRVRWVRASVMANISSQITSAKQSRDFDLAERLRRKWRDWLSCDILILDDFNRSEIPKNPYTTQAIEHTIKWRLDVGKSTFVTTNLSEAGFKREFGKNVFSWLSERNEFLTGVGDDMRRTVRERNAVNA